MSTVQESQDILRAFESMKTDERDLGAHAPGPSRTG